MFLQGGSAVIEASRRRRPPRGAPHAAGVQAASPSPLRGPPHLPLFSPLRPSTPAVLKGIESLRTRNVSGSDLRLEIFKLLDANRLGDLSNPEIRRRDEVSHQILRLAYANNLENQRWFVTMEVALFRARLEREPPAQVSAFMGQYEFSFDVVSEEEIKANKDDIRDVLLANPMRPTDIPFEAMPSTAELAASSLAEPFYKVPFTQALGLVKARQVFIRGGQAYIPTSRIRVIIVDRFATYVSCCCCH